MDSGILSSQLEKLPACGLAVDLKSHFHFLYFIYLIFFLLLILSVFLLPVPLWQAVALGIVLFWFCVQIFGRHIHLYHPSAVKKLVFTEAGWCYVQLNNDKIYKADICTDTILTEHLVILNLKRREIYTQSPHQLMALLYKHKRSSIFLTSERTGRNIFRKVKRHLRLIDFIKINRLKKENGERTI